MVALPVREIIERKLNNLTEDQLTNVLHYIEVMELPGQLVKDDNDDDPLVGFISGPTDLAERTEDILWAEFGFRDSDDKP
ncbi:MAG: hypothetical protein R3E39_24555 [Anaerolineae bacterium]